MVNPIVIVNVSQTLAPTPNNLQKTGALISQGGTTLQEGTYSLLTEEADLDAILTAPLALTSVAWSSGLGGSVTGTTAVAHGIPVNTFFKVVIADTVPTGYNGTFNAIATGASTFLYYLETDPGAQTTAGTYNPYGELIAMANTFFAQRATQGVYVLELGAGTPANGVTALEEFIEDNGQFFYSYLVPTAWAADSTFQALAADYEAPTAMTYFFTTIDVPSIDAYESITSKSLNVMVPAPFYEPHVTVGVDAAAWATGVVTLTTDANHGIVPGELFTVASINPTGYNGTFVAVSGTTGTALKYLLADDPGAYVSGGDVSVQVHESAGPPATEFSHASDFNVTLNYAPSNTNKVTPLAFSYLFSVTPFPTPGNGPLLTNMLSNNLNYVGLGNEAGVTNDILRNGRMMDGKPFNYWYSVDWMHINGRLNLANCIVNGSNNPINPLYYNQDGINRLQDVLARTAESAVTFGLALGRVYQVGLPAAQFAEELNKGTYAGNIVINAIPFTDYAVANPSHYSLGIYNGLSLTYTPLRGFEQITVNINVTDFVA